MSTKQKIISIDNPAVVAECVEAFARGGVILYPTDTVYGLGADATNPEAVAKITRIKNRADSKSFLVMVPSVSMLEQYAEVSAKARELAHAFLPGPLALVLKTKKDSTPLLHTNNNGTIGFRVPNSLFCRELGEQFQKPIISTSANISGQIQPKSIKEILEQLGDRANTIDVYVDAGESTSNTPSTIVEVLDNKIIVLREGAVSKTELAASGIRCA